MHQTPFAHVDVGTSAPVKPAKTGTCCCVCLQSPLPTVDEGAEATHLAEVNVEDLISPSRQFLSFIYYKV